MEKQIRDIIGQHVGGTYEAKQKAVDEILLLFSVSQQREQLISFLNWYKDDPKEVSNNETIVDAYLEEINCG
jgi:hypothetical protein